MSGGQELAFLVTRKALKIALRRVRAGRVRTLLGGEIVEAGRPVPGYVTSALHELMGREQVRLVECVSGEGRFEITHTGRVLHDELTRPRAPSPPEERWPQLAFLLDANPPWTFTTLYSGVVAAACRHGRTAESLWVINDRRAGYIHRRAALPDPAAECTFRGPVHRLAVFLRASTDVSEEPNTKD